MANSSLYISHNLHNEAKTIPHNLFSPQTLVITYYMTRIFILQFDKCTKSQKNFKTWNLCYITNTGYKMELHFNDNQFHPRYHTAMKWDSAILSEDSTEIKYLAWGYK